MLTNYPSLTRLTRPRWFLPLTSLLTTIAAGCASTTVMQEKPASTVAPAQELAPGIPNLPELVTVVPFYTKPNETDREKTKAVIPAEIDGRRGIFIFDLGDEPMMLNRTYLQPNAAGGVDTVTDANRIPDNTPRTDYMNNQNFAQFDKAHVTVRIGTLVSHFDDAHLTEALHDSDPHHYNVMLGHLWGDFGWVFAPRLGNIGPAAIESFEAIVDYTHKRVVLIQLDSAGHRKANIPAYTPRWTGPLLNIPSGLDGVYGLGINVGSDNMLDTLDATKNTETKVIDTGAPEDEGEILGFPFLSQFGVFGINQRTHQFILYH
jgi:hypothetical protein